MNNLNINKYVLKILARIVNRKFYPQYKKIINWSFGFNQNNLSIIQKLRSWIWFYCLKNKIKISIPVKWLEKTKLKLTLGDDLSRLIYIMGLFEPNEFAALSKILKPGMTVIDIGAHIGSYSIPMAKLVSPQGVVFSIEPSKREMTRLKENIRINEIKNIITKQIAISDTEGTVKLKVAEQNHNGQNTIGEFAYKIKQLKNVKIKTRNLQNIINKYKIKNVDFIKIDCEGAEFKVLKGGSNILKKNPPILLIELLREALHKQGSDEKKIIKFLKNKKYKILVLKKNTGAWTLFSKKNKLSENILAIPKQKILKLHKKINTE